MEHLESVDEGTDRAKEIIESNVGIIMDNAQEQDTIFFVDIQIKRPIYIFFNLPNLFFNEDSRSKFQVNVGQDLFLDVTYEILQNNFKEHCLKYPKTFNGSYDHCKIKEIERRNIFFLLEKVLPLAYWS